MYNFLNVYKDLILTNISFKILYYILHMHDSIQMYCSHTLQKKNANLFTWIYFENKNLYYFSINHDSCPNISIISCRKKICMLTQ